MQYGNPFPSTFGVFGYVYSSYAVSYQLPQTDGPYMGMGALPEICRQMVKHGLPAATPAAVVQSATTRKQKVVSGSLETLPHLSRAAGMRAPALIVIGEVVKLRRTLAWFAPHCDEQPAVQAAV